MPRSTGEKRTKRIDISKKSETKKKKRKKRKKKRKRKKKEKRERTPRYGERRCVYNARSNALGVGTRATRTMHVYRGATCVGWPAQRGSPHLRREFMADEIFYHNNTESKREKEREREGKRE